MLRERLSGMIAEWRLSMLLVGERISEVMDAQFPSASGIAELRGIVHAPDRPNAGLVIAHGRSNDLRNPLVRRVAEAVASEGIWALRFDFRYVEAKGQASRDLLREEDDLHGAIRFAREAVASHKIFLAGKSMGARVCARASADPEVAGVIALGYPLHPRFRPEVLNPPEWPYLVKPALFVQGGRDPFCDLERLPSLPPRPRAPQTDPVSDAPPPSFGLPPPHRWR